MPRLLGKLLAWLAAFILLIGGIGWYKFLRPVPQPAFADDEEWFKYGSFEGEGTTGLPYWIWLVLPQVFPDLLPGSGGYRSLGLVWEQGKEMPVGLAKKTLGFPRVTENCALCHAATYRLRAGQSVPAIAIGAPAHTFDIQKLILFLAQAAADPRFNADTLLGQIEQETHLSLLDRLSYRFLIIPLTRKALLKQGEQFAWMSRPGHTPWGPGRDDAFNLPKYNLAHLPDDGSSGPVDFGSLWRLGGGGTARNFHNWGGESPTVRTVLMDSSIGFGPKPGRAFESKLDRLGRFLEALEPPPWPYATGEHALRPELAAAGRSLYLQQCASCHEPGAARCGTCIPLAEIGTDPARANVWTQAAADEVNRTVRSEGFDRPALVKNDGYLASPLTGIWLRAPYLHNGSVPNLRELLEPEERRSPVFYRGYDVYDPLGVGFVSAGPEPERFGFRFDVRQPGNGHGGHTYGTTLSASEKRALLEYLKTL